MYRPSYLQKTSAECGIACIGYVAAHYGKTYTLTQLRSLAGLSSRGTTLMHLIGLGGKMQLQVRAIRAPLEALVRLTLPAILHWNSDHFVVLVGFKRGKLHLHDPARGIVTLSLAEASPHFTGVALELAPSDAFVKERQAVHVSWRKLVGKIHGLKRSLGQVFYLAAVLQLTILLTPLFTQWIVDNAIVAGDTHLLYVLLGGLSLFLLIKVGLEAVRGWLSIIAATQFTSQWGTKVVSHMLRLPVQWFEVRHTGDVVSRFQSMQSIQAAVTGRLIDIFLDGFFASIVLIVLFSYSAKLASVVILAISIYAIMRIVPHGKFHMVSDEALVHEAKAQSHFLENLRAMQVIKLAGLENLRTAQWTAMAVEAVNKRAIAQKMTLAFGSGYSLIFALESVTILGIGASMAISGTLTIGMLMAFIAYKDEFSSRVQRFIDNIMGVRMLRLHSERLSDIVLADTEKLETDALPAARDISAPLLEVDSLSFRYGEHLPWVFKDLSLRIESGEHVAIVGPTGCGKTTLVKVLLGLLEPTSGTVKLNGIAAGQYGLLTWRAQVAAVMQDDQLFSGSIRDNIACFDEDVKLDDVRRAATLAGIDSEISAMPMGYSTLNGDMGSSLSGGQRQRVLLARALCRRPKFLVLDEATSHLDVDTERHVNAAISTLRATRVTIAHRPETIASADRVIALKTA